MFSFRILIVFISASVSAHEDPLRQCLSLCRREETFCLSDGLIVNQCEFCKIQLNGRTIANSGRCKNAEKLRNCLQERRGKFFESLVKEFTRQKGRLNELKIGESRKLDEKFDHLRKSFEALKMNKRKISYKSRGTMTPKDENSLYEEAMNFFRKKRFRRSKPEVKPEVVRCFQVLAEELADLRRKLNDLKSRRRRKNT